MVGGCLSCFLTCSFVLLLGFCSSDAESSMCPTVITAKVGATVELSSGLPPDEVSRPQWKFQDEFIVDDDGVKPELKRLEFNSQNFSLTVNHLTTQDTGTYLFTSDDKNDTQRPTVCISLHVIEAVSQPSITTVNSTRSTNESCTLFLVCRANPNTGVSYSWTVKNETKMGSSLFHTIRVQDGKTNVTCKAYNDDSSQSVVKTVGCSDDAQAVNFVTIMIAAGGGCVVFVVAVGVVIAVYYKCRQSQTAGSDATDLTVYADIAEVTTDEISSKMKPCSVYETIDKRGGPVVPAPSSGPQTVYDQIQLNRLRKASVSPYQEIS